MKPGYQIIANFDARLKKMEILQIKKLDALGLQ